MNVVKNNSHLKLILIINMNHEKITVNQQNINKIIKGN